MGLYLSTYAGPVILAECTIETTSIDYRSCGNPECKRHKKTVESPFCPECGGKQVVLSKECKSVSPSHEALMAAGIDSDVLEDNPHIEEVLPPLCRLYTPNEHRNPPRDFHPDSPQCCVVDMTQVDVKAEIQWMETAFAWEIATLRTLYKKVEILWMFVNYRS